MDKDTVAAAQKQMRRAAPESDQHSNKKQKKEHNPDDEPSFIELNRYDYTGSQSLASGVTGFLLTCKFKREKTAMREFLQYLECCSKASTSTDTSQQPSKLALIDDVAKLWQSQKPELAHFKIPAQAVMFLQVKLGDAGADAGTQLQGSDAVLQDGDKQLQDGDKQLQYSDKQSQGLGGGSLDQTEGPAKEATKQVDPVNGIQSDRDRDDATASFVKGLNNQAKQSQKHEGQLQNGGAEQEKKNCDSKTTALDTSAQEKNLNQQNLDKAKSIKATNFVYNIVKQIYNQPLNILNKQFDSLQRVIPIWTTCPNTKAGLAVAAENFAQLVTSSGFLQLEVAKNKSGGDLVQGQICIAEKTACLHHQSDGTGNELAGPAASIKLNQQNEQANSSPLDTTENSNSENIQVSDDKIKADENVKQFKGSVVFGVGHKTRSKVLNEFKQKQKQLNNDKKTSEAQNQQSNDFEWVGRAEGIRIVAENFISVLSNHGWKLSVDLKVPQFIVLIEVIEGPHQQEVAMLSLLPPGASMTKPRIAARHLLVEG